jgi:hypothetical protein
MSDTTGHSTPLRAAREQAELSREAVTRRPELDPPVSAKTLERWEQPGYRVKRARLRQLALIYGVSVEKLEDGA